MNCNLAVIKGDGIGPEIVTEAMRVLDAVGEKYGHTFSYTQILMGGASIDVHGEPLTEEALEIAKKSDAVLMGSIGGNTSTSPWYKLPAQLRPEAGLLKLRKSLGLFANIRPAYLYDELKKACPLRDEVIGDGFDMVIMRELTGGLYFGERHTEEIDGVRTAVDTLSYNENEIRRIAIKAFDIARKRKKHVISVDKANVLDSSRLWRTVVEEVAKDYEDVTYEHMLVDNCAMQLVNNPRQFDVILTENMFGDILSDEASMITGSIGMLSSASLNESKFGLYEPSHGSAPDIAGKDIANPLATILSAAMLLRYSCDLDKEALAVEAAVHGDVSLLKQAALMDPLTGAVCNPPEIWQMIDEMLVAQEEWLPQYKEGIEAAKTNLKEHYVTPRCEGYKGAAVVREKTVEEVAAEHAKRKITV